MQIIFVGTMCCFKLYKGCVIMEEAENVCMCYFYNWKKDNLQLSYNF